MVALLTLAGPDVRTVSGRVVGPDGEPAEGAVVELTVGGRTTRRRTDAEGDFRLHCPTDESGVLSVTGSSGLVRRYQLREGGTSVSAGELVPGRSGTVVGRVVDPLGNVLVDGVGLALVRRSWSGELKPLPDQVQPPIDAATGEFRAGGLPPGEYVLYVWSGNAPPSPDPVPVLVEGDREVFVEATCGQVVLSCEPVCEDPGVVWFRGEPAHAVPLGGGDRVRARRREGGTYYWDRLDPGHYRLELGDGVEWLDPVHARHHASLEEVRFRATRGVELHFVPGPDGAPPPTRVHLESSIFRQDLGREDWYPGRGPLPVALPGGDRTLVLARSDGEPWAVRLRAGEGWTRQEVHLPPAQELLVRLAEGPWGLETARRPVEVRCTIGAGGEVTWKRERRTAAGGTLVLSRDPRALLSLEVQWTPWTTTVHEIPPGDAVTRTVQPPAVGWIEGRLAFPEDVALADWRVHGGERGDAVVLDSEGRFRLGPYEPGEREVELLGGVDLELGKVRVEAGEVTRLDRDVTGLLPGRVHVRVDTSFARSARLHPLGPVRGKVRLWRGEGELLVPAGEYRLEVSAGAYRWSYEHPEIVRVPSGERVRVDVAVPLHRRRVELVGANGAPVVEDVHLRSEGAWVWEPRVKEDGSFSANLPPGRVRIWTGEEVDAVEVEWGPGEEPLRVRLGRNGGSPRHR